MGSSAVATLESSAAERLRSRLRASHPSLEAQLARDYVDRLEFAVTRKGEGVNALLV